MTPGKVIWHDKACHMQWLPRDTRYCFVKESYDKRASERARKPVVSYRLNPVPEARLTYPEGHSGGGVTWHTVTYTHTEDEVLGVLLDPSTAPSALRCISSYHPYPTPHYNLPPSNPPSHSDGITGRGGSFLPFPPLG